MSGLEAKDVLREMITKHPKYSVEEIADGIGSSYSMLSNAVNLNLPKFNLGSHKIIPLTKFLNDFRFLDFCEASCGRVAFTLPEIPSQLDGLDSMIANNVHLYGSVLSEIGNALSDGVIDDIEMKRIEACLLDQVRRSMGMLLVLKKAKEDQVLVA